MLTKIHKALGIKTQLDSASAASAKQALFTFDDGPDPTVTGSVLDVLDEVGAKAVFFVVGNRIQKAAHMLQEVLDRGHLIGNHSHSHWPGNPPALPEYLADVKNCQQRISDACGYTPTLYRPPLGAVNLATLATARKLNLDIYKWSLDTNDWRLRDDSAAKTQGIELTNQAAHRDVILMHDDNIHTPVMLREMLQRMSDQDFDLHSFVDTYHMQYTPARRSA